MNVQNERNLSMLADFYELTMANGYFEQGCAEKTAVFDMFFRKVPDNAGFAIAAGLEQLMEYLDALHFTCLLYTSRYDKKFGLKENHSF